MLGDVTTTVGSEMETQIWTYSYVALLMTVQALQIVPTEFDSLVRSFRDLVGSRE